MSRVIPEEERKPLPSFLLRTPEQRAEDEERQRVLAREFGPRARLTPEERWMRHAVEREKVMRGEVEAALRDGDDAKLSHAKRELAEALADQGRFEEAYTEAPDEERAEEFKRKLEALRKPDTEECNCPDVPLAAELVMREGKLTPMVVCQGCGHANVRPLPEVLAKRDALAREGLPDTEILKRME